MILLDTHALIWLAEGDKKFGNTARRLSDDALQEDTLTASAITFWEVAMLQQRGRIQLKVPVEVWRKQLIELGLVELPLTGEIAIASTRLESFPPDPADRFIAATALCYGMTLVTADMAILDWSGALNRHDARS